MTISVKLLNDQIKKISETNTLLDMLLEFEKTLDNIDLYAYKNWSKGEVLEGPTLDRHYVGLKLLYKQSEMPDPAGAKRLFARNCLVKYYKDDLLSPVKVKTFDDITTDISNDGRVRHKAKTKTEPVWVVEIKMPRRYVDEFTTEIVQSEENSYVDTESLNAEQQAENEAQLSGGQV
jgi:hypothetical protein